MSPESVVILGNMYFLNCIQIRIYYPIFVIDIGWIYLQDLVCFMMYEPRKASIEIKRYNIRRILIPVI